MEIVWYPGHMAKAKRLLAEQLGKVDIVVELCDARLPHASRNPDLDKLAQGKRRVLLLNKADLADPQRTAEWIKVFKSQGIAAMPFTATAGRTKEALALLEKAARDLLEKYAAKGARKTIRAMVVGVPNVGKSTFVNCLHGKTIAKTGDRPGVTRTNQWVKINPFLELLDTPGLLWPRLDDTTAARRLAYIGSVKDDVVDTSALTIHLLEDMLDTNRDATVARFHLQNGELRGAELLDEVCRGRGFLLKGGNYDYDRCCHVVLDEFRGGKLGKLTLEVPEKEKETNDEAGREVPGADRL